MILSIIKWVCMVNMCVFFMFFFKYKFIFFNIFFWINIKNIVYKFRFFNFIFIYSNIYILNFIILNIGKKGIKKMGWMKGFEFLYDGIIICCVNYFIIFVILICKIIIN